MSESALFADDLFNTHHGDNDMKEGHLDDFNFALVAGDAAKSFHFDYFNQHFDLLHNEQHITNINEQKRSIEGEDDGSIEKMDSKEQLASPAKKKRNSLTRNQSGKWSDRIPIGSKVKVDYEGNIFEAKVVEPPNTMKLVSNWKKNTGVRMYALYYEEEDSIEYDVLEKRIIRVIRIGE